MLYILLTAKIQIKINKKVIFINKFLNLTFLKQKERSFLFCPPA